MVPKIEFRWVVLATVVCLAMGWFYWFEYRPVAVTKACGLEAEEGAVIAFAARIETGEFKGQADGDEKLSTEELQKKYKGYRDDEDQDAVFRHCLEAEGLKGLR